MAYTTFEHSSANYSGPQSDSDNSSTITLDATQGKQLALPEGSYVTEADMLRDGYDLVLQTPEGTVVVENYFAQEPPPFLTAPDGKTLTPDLVESFAHSPQEYASNQTVSDASPVGAVQEITGEAHVIHTDGTVEIIGVGTHIYQGDVIETEEDGAVNIMFIDETTFAISEDARLAIDEYVFDPATQSGETNFSVLKGVFVFTSGLIGREDPDDVMIDTPSGSIGIRGTIIAGDVDSGEITVIEGAIVLHDFNGNTVTLSNQYETARFNTSGQSIDYMGELDALDVAVKFTSVSNVSGDLFSSIEDSAAENQDAQGENVQSAGEEAEAEVADEVNADGEPVAEDQPVEAGAEGTEPVDTAEEPATAEPPATEIITSDEITGSNVEDLNTDTTTDPVQDTTSEPVEIVANTTTDPVEAELATTTETDTSSQPVFHIDIFRPYLPEGTPANSIVARVTGNFTEHTDLFLRGLSSNFYQVDRIDENSFVIRTLVDIDAENYHPLNIEAVNDLGTNHIVDTIPLNMAPVNDPIVLTNAADPLYFSGTADSHTVYNMSQEFVDPEGRINHYDITNISSNVNLDEGGSGIVIDQTTGLLTIDLDNAATDETFTFTVRASASDGTYADQTFTYTSHASDGYNAGGTFLTANNVEDTDSPNIYILSDNVTVYANADPIDNTNIQIAGANATVYAGEGNDTFSNIADDYFRLYGEAGNDTFTFTDANSHPGFAYGGDGDDTFNINNYQRVQLETGTTTDTGLDGGSGYDELVFTDAGNVDFGAINAGILENFEALNFENSQTNVIDLSYNDVINMTGDGNVLAINTDVGGNDTVNFNNTQGTTFVNTGVVNQQGEDYNVFTDGHITLLIDTDINPANVTGI